MGGASPSTSFYNKRACLDFRNWITSDSERGSFLASSALWLRMNQRLVGNYQEWQILLWGKNQQHSFSMTSTVTPDPTDRHPHKHSFMFREELWKQLLWGCGGRHTGLFLLQPLILIQLRNKMNRQGWKLFSRLTANMLWYTLSLHCSSIQNCPIKWNPQCLHCILNKTEALGLRPTSNPGFRC